MIELNKNDITSSSVETEKATYDVKQNLKPIEIAQKIKIPGESAKKLNPEKVFAYNKYLGAMQALSPDE